MLKIYSSFRDPSGYVFSENNEIYRTISKSAMSDFEYFKSSQLYQSLIDKKQIIQFYETDMHVEGYAKVVKVDKIPFITYPYEWSFSMIKDAALLTLDIHINALKHGMVLKDATAYNISFLEGKPIFIDLLSFEKYIEGSQWVAYKQFIQFFYGTMLLMSKKDIRFNLALLHNIDGFPIDFVSNNLGISSWLNISTLMHVHLHAKMINKHSNTHRKTKVDVKKLDKNDLINIAKQLKDAVKGVKLPKVITEWGDYYNDTNYNDESFKIKQNIVEDIAKRFSPNMAVDLGANDGTFSKILAKHSKMVISADIDPIAVELNYKHNIKNILPVLQNLVTPSPAIGFMNKERDSFIQRCKVDMAFALALIHHLAIGNNLPFSYIAEMFASIAKVAVIEFVPKEDSQVQRLLSARQDIFTEYNEECFKNEFLKYYKTFEVFNINGSSRNIYLFQM